MKITLLAKYRESQKRDKGLRDRMKAHIEHLKVIAKRKEELDSKG